MYKAFHEGLNGVVAFMVIGLSFGSFTAIGYFFFQLRWTKKLKINLFCSKEWNINKPVLFCIFKVNKCLRIISKYNKLFSENFQYLIDQCIQILISFYA